MSVDLPANIIATVYLPLGNRFENNWKISVQMDYKEIEGDIEKEFVKIDKVGVGIHVFNILVF